MAAWESHGVSENTMKSTTKRPERPFLHTDLFTDASADNPSSLLCHLRPGNTRRTSGPGRKRSKRKEKAGRLGEKEGMLIPELGHKLNWLVSFRVAICSEVSLKLRVGLWLLIKQSSVLVLEKSNCQGVDSDIQRSEVERK